MIVRLKQFQVKRVGLIRSVCEREESCNSAQQEAQRFQHSYIATEHILLGPVREDQGRAAEVPDSLGVTLERARKQTVRLLGHE